MQVTETLNEGLKREVQVVVPKDEMQTKLDIRLVDLKDRVKLNGFRPGKVPLAHVKKLYGKSVMAEIVQDTIDEQAKSILAEREEKAAQRPEIVMTEDEKEAEKILAGDSDFEFKVSYEVLPPFEVTDLSKLEIERPVVEVDSKEVDEQIERIAESTRSYETKDGKAADKDRVKIDFLGKIDGDPFDGGAGEEHELVLGSNSFIPGFEDQLIGVKAGNEKTVSVTFPEDYSAENLAGKEATFEVKVHEVSAPGKLEVNDGVAEKLGVESLDKLKEIVTGQIESQHGDQSRQKVKRQLLDQLDEKHTFELPGKMVEQEFDNIWRQITKDLEDAGRTFEDEDTTEEKAREDYRKLAERRVRLGLVLSEIGEKAGIEISEQEMQQAIYEQVRQHPGQEKEVFEFFKSTPDAVAGLRAPIFEEKVVDHILEQAKVTDKKVSKEDLMKDDEMPV